MKTFDALVFDERKCAGEVAEFQALLAANPDLKERQDILPFFRSRPQLSALVGLLDPYLVHLDRIAYEYDLFGDFTVDLVVGDSVSKAYGFIEFEDRFGARQVKYFGLLVVGRSELFASREKRRLEWRQERTVVNSRHVRCLTFDQLATSLERQLERYPRSSKKR
jgi:hypothetical protein